MIAHQNCVRPFRLSPVRSRDNRWAASGVVRQRAAGDLELLGVIMTTKKKETVQAESLDVGAAEQAFLQLQPDLLRLDGSQLQPVRVDLQMCAAVAYSVAIRDNADARRAKLALVAQGGVFDLAVLDRLPLIALAAWHVRRKQTEALEAASGARVLEATLREAQQTRGRMLQVLTHYFGDHPAYSKRITAIRAGTGYLDLANDLISVAELYEVPEVNAIVSRDPMHYRADDPQHARDLAQQLFRSLGLLSEGEAASWTDLAQRAWTMLSQNYNSLRAAGQLVFRNEEDVDVTYPSLVAAVRAPATRVRPTPPEPQPGPAPAAG